ncbi:MAG: hypothetical protein HYZ61_03145 [Candidatus Andersenbacteria bacterium]|nr:hypothetical protein [Candidatus Andersenbacteria bacterium]
MNMQQKIISMLVLAGLVVGQTALAVSETEEVSTEDVQATRVPIDGIVISRCGSQEIYFSGSIISQTPTEYLIVKLDNVEIPHTLNGNLWITDLVSVGVGTHKVKSELVETDTITNYYNPFSTHQRTFAVHPCPTPTPAPDPTPSPTPTPTPIPAATSNNDNGGGSSDGGGGGGGDSEEPQPTPKPAVKKGQVKGITTKKVIAGAIPNKLVPAVVARIFKEVFGRTIKPFESTYWKLRARTDKVTEALLKGTMQWYKLKGKTVGK